MLSIEPAFLRARVRSRRGKFSTLAVALLLFLAAGCDEGLQPVGFEGISGTVTFRGAAPDSTDWVRLVVYRDLPRSISDFFNFVAFSDPLPLGAPSQPYSLALPPGSYAWLLAVWKKVGASFDSTTLREAGTYYGERDPTEGPASFAVQEGKETQGLDIVVDFERMRSVSDLFPSAGAPVAGLRQ